MLTRSRIVLFTGLLLALAAGAAGCSGSSSGPIVASVGSPTAGTGSAPATDRATLIRQYADCMRRQGVRLVVTPTAEGLPQIDKQRTPVEKVSAALVRCRAYLPTASDAPPRISPADLAARQRYSACIRAHGVPDYPDPDPQTGEPVLTGELGARVKNNPALRPALEACRTVLPSPTASGTVGG